MGDKRTATFVKEFPSRFGNKKLWAIDDGTFVVSSSAEDDHYMLNETMVFVSNKDGLFDSSAEISCVDQSGMHEQAIEEAGFTITEDGR